MPLQREETVFGFACKFYDKGIVKVGTTAAARFTIAVQPDEHFPTRLRHELIERGLSNAADIPADAAEEAAWEARKAAAAERKAASADAKAAAEQAQRERTAARKAACAAMKAGEVKPLPAAKAAEVKRSVAKLERAVHRTCADANTLTKVVSKMASAPAKRQQTGIMQFMQACAHDDE